MYVCIDICIEIYAYVCMCVCMYACMYVCVYVCICARAKFAPSPNLTMSRRAQRSVCLSVGSATARGCAKGGEAKGRPTEGGKKRTWYVSGF